MDFDKIKIAARKKGLTVKEMLSELQIPESNFYNWQKKGSLETKYLEKIAVYLGVPVGYFFGEPVGLSQSGTGNVVVNGDIKAREVKQILSHSHELEKENERLKAELRGCQELLKSKDEIIKLLKEQNKNR